MPKKSNICSEYAYAVRHGKSKFKNTLTGHRVRVDSRTGSQIGHACRSTIPQCEAFGYAMKNHPRRFLNPITGKRIRTKSPAFKIYKAGCKEVMKHSEDTKRAWSYFKRTIKRVKPEALDVRPVTVKKITKYLSSVKSFFKEMVETPDNDLGLVVIRLQAQTAFFLRVLANPEKYTPVLKACAILWHNFNSLKKLAATHDEVTPLMERADELIEDLILVNSRGSMDRVFARMQQYRLELREYKKVVKGAGKVIVKMNIPKHLLAKAKPQALTEKEHPKQTFFFQPNKPNGPVNVLIPKAKAKPLVLKKLAGKRQHEEDVYLDQTGFIHPVKFKKSAFALNKKPKSKSGIPAPDEEVPVILPKGYKLGDIVLEGPGNPAALEAALKALKTFTGVNDAEEIEVDEDGEELMPLEEDDEDMPSIDVVRSDLSKMLAEARHLFAAEKKKGRKGEYKDIMNEMYVTLSDLSGYMGVQVKKSEHLTAAERLENIGGDLDAKDNERLAADRENLTEEEYEDKYYIPIMDIVHDVRDMRTTLNQLSGIEKAIKQNHGSKNFERGLVAYLNGADRDRTRFLTIAANQGDTDAAEELEYYRAKARGASPEELNIILKQFRKNHGKNDDSR